MNTTEHRIKLIRTALQTPNDPNRNLAAGALLQIAWELGLPACIFCPADLQDPSREDFPVDSMEEAMTAAGWNALENR